MAILGVGQVAVEAAVAPGDGLVGEHDSCDSLNDSLVTAYLVVVVKLLTLLSRRLTPAEVPLVKVAEDLLPPHPHQAPLSPDLMF